LELEKRSKKVKLLKDKLSKEQQEKEDLEL